MNGAAVDLLVRPPRPSRYLTQAAASDGVVAYGVALRDFEGGFELIQIAHGGAAPGPRRPFYRSLYFQVIVAIVLGGTIGHFWPTFGESLKPLGDAFIKLVKMIIAPVIFLTIVTGIAGMSDLKRVGRVAGKAFAYFLTFSTLALIVGLIIANIVQPGRGLNIDPATLDAGAVAQYADAAHESTIVGFLTGIIPDTLVSAFATGNILQVLFVSILFGIAMAIVGDAAAPVQRAFESLSAIVFRLVAILMKAAPIGAFGAFAFTIGAYGIGAITNLAALIATFYLTSLVFVLGVLGVVAWVNGFSIFKLIAYLKEELLLVAMLSSKGAAGITGAGFITLAATLSVVPDVPVAGMALILGIDRFMSECRALTNFIGNAVATIVVARWEGALDRDALNAALEGGPQPLAAAPDPAAGPGDDLVLADD